MEFRRGLRYRSSERPWHLCLKKSSSASLCMPILILAETYSSSLIACRLLSRRSREVVIVSFRAAISTDSSLSITGYSAILRETENSG